MNAATWKKLAPAVVHIARFTGCNLGVVCVQRGVHIAEIQAAAQEIAGSVAALDDERLAEWAIAEGFTVPAWVKSAPMKMAPLSPPNPRVEAPRIAAIRTAAAPQVRAAKTIGARVTVTEPSPVTDRERGRPRARDHLFLEVCNELLESAGRTAETAACVRHGLSTSTWAYFKKSRLGLGALDPIKLHSEACRLARAINADAPRLPGMWLGPQHPVALANLAKTAPAAAAFGGKSSGEVSGVSAQERRHLVAVILAGSLAGSLTADSETNRVQRAFSYVDELTKQDAARQAAVMGGGK